MISSRPALVIDERGIQDNISAIGSGIGMIPWKDIVALTAYSRSNGGAYPTPRFRYLGISVMDPAQILPRYPRYLRWMYRSSTAPYYVHVVIPQRIIHGSVDEVLDQIAQRYAAILTQHQIALREDDGSRLVHKRYMG